MAVANAPDTVMNITICGDHTECVMVIDMPLNGKFTVTKDGQTSPVLVCCASEFQGDRNCAEGKSCDCWFINNLWICSFFECHKNYRADGVNVQFHESVEGGAE
jgi:hypothetical protein